MACWDDVSVVAAEFGGQRLSQTMWLFEVQGKHPSRHQKVFVSLEVMPPDFESVRIGSPIGLMSELEPSATLRLLGQLQVGAVIYTPTDDDAIISIGTTIPLGVLDLTQPYVLMLYINLLAQAADNVEWQTESPEQVDRF